MRTRTRDGRSNGPSCYSVETDVDSAHKGVWTYNVGVPLVGEKRSFTDVVTPKFQKVLQEQRWVNNPMSMFAQGTAVMGNAHMVKSTTQTYASGVYGFWDYQGCHKALRMGLNNPDKVLYERLVDADMTSRIISEAATACWAQAAEIQANLFVSVAEMGDTVRMLRKPFASVLDLMDGAMRRYRKKSGFNKPRPNGADYRDAVQNSWMESRYGWRPFISDIKGVLDALNLERNPGEVKTFRAKTRKEFTASRTVVDDWGGALTTYRYDTRETVLCRPYLMIDQVVELSQSLGLSLTGAMQVPWEIIPCSFVLDWVGNVGNFITGIGAYASMKPVVSGYTLTKEFELSVQAVNSVPVSIRSMIRPSTERVMIGAVEKNRITSLPSPQLTIKADWMQANDIKHIMDLASILKSRFFKTAR